MDLSSMTKTRSNCLTTKGKREQKNSLFFFCSGSNKFFNIFLSLVFIIHSGWQTDKSSSPLFSLSDWIKTNVKSKFITRIPNEFECCDVWRKSSRVFSSNIKTFRSFLHGDVNYSWFHWKFAFVLRFYSK